MKNGVQPYPAYCVMHAAHICPEYVRPVTGRSHRSGRFFITQRHYGWPVCAGAQKNFC